MKRDGVAQERKAKIPIPAASYRVFQQHTFAITRILIHNLNSSRAVRLRRGVRLRLTRGPQVESQRGIQIEKDVPIKSVKRRIHIFSKRHINPSLDLCPAGLMMK